MVRDHLIVAVLGSRDRRAIAFHHQALLRASAHAASALDAEEWVYSPFALFLGDLYAMARAGLGANAAKYALGHVADDMPLLARIGLLLLERVLERLRLLEERSQSHSAKLESAHLSLPLRAADARVYREYDHVHVCKVASL